MSANHLAAPPKHVTLDNLTLSRKEGFRERVESTGRVQPELLTARQLRALSEKALRQYNRERATWHANLPTIKTAQLAALYEDLHVIVASNLQDGDKAKGAIAIEGPAGVGKSTAILAFSGEFHRVQISDFGRFTENGNERWPVCRVGMTGNTGMKDFNRAMLAFYNHAGTRRGTAADFADRALDCMLACETKLLVVDDLHFLKQRTTSVEISNQFKYISNEFPVTIIFLGIGLEQRGLYSDGTYANGILGQSGRRITPLSLREFEIGSDEHYHEWRRLLLAIEKRIVLTHRRRGMLVDHSELLYERSSGRIGPLITLVNRACQLAMRMGTEFINRDLLESVRMDAASDRQRTESRAKVRKALARRTQNTSRSKSR
ncbi:AAA family ATPase [Mycobacterium colombiense]|uniref:TniB family NTP-binding protein n=1 Tax=Mycobacterium colombiense TaxID=339268 RepID=UPI0007EF1B5B|nr:TniB family NTP-binding protein [Mycobacterium colombiense]OBK67158.1 AAA family ATPase [Mycobacterium colombiense]